MKQVILVRTDLGMGKGKIAVQVAHASLGAYKSAVKKFPEKVKEWEREGEKKIVLKAKLQEILEAKKWADSRGIPNFLVRDAGLTQLEPGTITALAIGPWEENELDSFFARFKLL